MATSTNYGWAEPDNTSLVRDGAQAIRTLGDAIDTSLWNSGFGQAGKNKIINGDFSVNQRAFTTSTAAVNPTYVADRIFVDSDGTGTVTKTYSAFTPGAAPVAGYEAKNYGTVQTTGQSAASVYTYLSTNVEDVRTFAGQPVTYSFWAKAASGTPKISIENRQVFGSGGSAAVNTNLGVVTLSTSWTRYSVTGTVASVTGKTIGAGSYSRFTAWVSAGTDFAARTNSIGIQTNTFDIWGVQVEYGAKATPFQTASGGSIQNELAMCQRYYWRGVCQFSYSNFGTGFGTASGAAQFQTALPVTMRLGSPVLDYSNLASWDGTTVTAFTTVILTGSQTSGDILAVTGTAASALTNFRPYALVANNNAAAYLGVSQEL